MHLKALRNQYDANILEIAKHDTCVLFLIFQYSFICYRVNSLILRKVLIQRTSFGIKQMREKQTFNGTIFIRKSRLRISCYKVDFLIKSSAKSVGIQKYSTFCVKTK